MAHGITPEPPAGSAHYQEGWRDGYAQAGIDADRLRAELEECRRTRALGGPPPPVDKNWANADVGRPSSADDPNAPAHRRDRNGGEPG